MNPIISLWVKIEDWMRKNAPFLVTTLNPGATSSQIKRFEQKFGLLFSDAYKALLSANNGQRLPQMEQPKNRGYFYGQHFLSLEDSFQKWEALVNSSDPDVQAVFKKTFIPLAGTIDPIIAIDANSEQIYEVFVLAPDWTMPAEWQIFHRVHFQSLFDYLKSVLQQLQVQNKYEWNKKDQCWYFINTYLDEE